MRVKHSVCQNPFTSSARGFTLPEVLVVIGVLAVLIALLVPALAGALRSTDLAKSQSSMKQIATYMKLYATDNRETVLPSQFDYTASAGAGYPVKVRSDSALGALRYKGTWADIIWTGFKLNMLDDTATGPLGKNYQFDSPDANAYDLLGDFDENILRSSAPITRDLPGITGTGPKPFGDGAREASYPGYFAANNFFNTDPAAAVVAESGGTVPGKWYTTGQIKAPDRSMYLVDSLAGETINPVAPAFDNNTDANGDGIPDTLEVDYRYSGVCLMLFLDGHSKPVPPWKDLPDLETQKKIRVTNLDRN